MNEQKKQNIPILQYALFCKEVIETGELTFKEVTHEVIVGRPKNIDITLALRLLNVPKGLHKIAINCLIPPLELIPSEIPLELKKRDNCFITQEFRLPIKSSSKYVFTILFDEARLIRFWLPVKVMPTQ